MCIRDSIEGALGDRDQLPPINFPEIGNLAPSFGFPIPVGEGGTVLLPLVKKVKVAGLTLEEAQEEINKAYTCLLYTSPSPRDS